MRHTSVGFQISPMLEEQKIEYLSCNKKQLELEHSAVEEDQHDQSMSKRSMKSSQSGKICRICFDETEEKMNPLISPCKCAGTMEFVHFKCLRQWRSRNENKKIAPHVTTYTWKAFHCELCKEKLQDSYEVAGKNFQIFEIIKPEKNFIVIESFQVNSNNDND